MIAFAGRLNVTGAGAALHLMSNRSLNAAGHGAVGDLIVTSDVSEAMRAQHHAYLSAKWAFSE